MLDLAATGINIKHEIDSFLLNEIYAKEFLCF